MRTLYSLALMFIAYASTTPGHATEFIYEYEEEQAEVSPIPEINSLKAVADSARTRGVPILVEFSTPWCRYCEVLARISHQAAWNTYNYWLFGEK
jgi:thioredoxin-like negative regulator of GroEL